MTTGMNRSYFRRTGRRKRANMVSSKIDSSGSAVNIESPPDAISVSTRQLIRMGGFEEPVMALVGYLAAYLRHLLGWLLFGIAALRAQILPRWPVVLAMVGPLLLFAGSAVLSEAPPVLLVPLPLLGAVGVAWLGLALVGLEREGEIRMATTGQNS
jgi:hypothetical protein